jgi:hypothetical protein
MGIHFVLVLPNAKEYAHKNISNSSGRTMNLFFRNAFFVTGDGNKEIRLPWIQSVL